eukprot:s271_g8.t1
MKQEGLCASATARPTVNESSCSRVYSAVAYSCFSCLRWLQSMMTEVSVAPECSAAQSNVNVSKTSMVSGDRSGDVEMGPSIHKEADGRLQFSFRDFRNCGIALHFFGMGFLRAGVDAIFFNVLEGYLNVPSNVMKSATNLVLMPSACTLAFGILSDSRPIFGVRRRPYMGGGFLLASASFVVLIVLGLPDPYFCFVNGRYLDKEAPCNPEAPDSYGPLMVCLCMANLGCVAATAAAQGLVVEYAKAEPEEIRGRTQARLQIVMCAGSISSVFLAAFGFNGREFTGSFNQNDQLSYRQFLVIFALVSGVVGISGLFCVREGPASRASIRAYCRSSWRVFESKAFCSFALYILANTAVFSIFTSAGTWVGLEWAGTKDMQRELSNFLGMILAVVGSWLTQRYLLNVSWRKTVFASIILPVVLDMAPQFLTIFDIVRNQYFYLGEPITSYVPEAMADLIYLFMVNEFADGDNSALVFGMVATVKAVGQPMSVMFSNEIFSFFTPDLFSSANYVEDTQAFRWTVASSFLLSYVIKVLGIGTLLLLPSQKEDAQQRKAEWSRRPVFAIISIAVLGVCLLFSLVGDFLDLEKELADVHLELKATKAENADWCERASVAADQLAQGQSKAVSAFLRKFPAAAALAILFRLKSRAARLEAEKHRDFIQNYWTNMYADDDSTIQDAHLDALLVSLEKRGGELKMRSEELQLEAKEAERKLEYVNALNLGRATDLELQAMNAFERSQRRIQEDKREEEYQKQRDEVQALFAKVHRRLQSELIELRDYKVLLREYRRVRLEKLSETLGKVQDGRRLRHCVRVMIRNGAQRILQRLESANLPLEPWMREVLLNCCYVEIRIEDAETQLLSLRREALKPVREDVQQMMDKTKAERFEDLFVRTLELRQQKLSTTASSEQEEKTMQMEPESACGDSVAPSNIGGESTSDFGSDMQRTKEKDNTPAVPIEKVRADVRALEGEITSLRRLLGDMRANAAAVICNHLRQAEKSAGRNWSPKEAAAWGHRMLSLLVSEDFATTTMKELLKLSPLRY